MNGTHTSAKLVPGEYIQIISTSPDGTKVEKKCEFKEVSRQTAARMRLKDVPYCIMRLGEKIYVAVLPEEYSQRSLWLDSDHLCDKCEFCRAMSSENGGCDKVHDRLLESLTSLTLQKVHEELHGKCEEEALQIKKAYVGYVRESKRLEKYPYISFGIETVHTGNDYFIVSNCTRFSPDTRKAYRPLVTVESITELMAAPPIYVNGVYKLT